MANRMTPTKPETQPPKPGCLSPATVLRLLFAAQDSERDTRVLAGADAFDLTSSLLTPGNRAFYEVLRLVTPESMVIFAELPLSALFEAKKAKGNQGARNRVNQKTVDFVLCERSTMRPLCGIEVDDRSRRRNDRVARDELVDDLFRSHQLPLLRVKGAVSYAPADIRQRLQSVIDLSQIEKGSVRP